MKNIASVYSVLGLGLLLLLSPCKVRNFVQAELGVEQTQVSSKSQSLAPQFSCQTQEIVQAKATTSKLEAKQFSYAGPINFSVEFDATFLQASIQNDYARPKVASSVPLYILYSNLKVYL